MVACSPNDAKDLLVQHESLRLVEVGSPSTAAYEREGKFAAYRNLPTLCEYLIVNPATRYCDLYRLGANGLWVLYPAAAGTSVHLASVDRTLTAEELWDEVAA